MTRALDELVQILLAAFGWLAFVWLWCNAILAGPSDSQLRSLLAVVAIDAVILVATMLWIRWNIALTRRKGPRRSSRTVEYDYERDSTGAPVRLEVAREDRFIMFCIEGEGSARTKVARPILGLDVESA